MRPKFVRKAVLWATCWRLMSDELLLPRKFEAGRAGMNCEPTPSACATAGTISVPCGTVVSLAVGVTGETRLTLSGIGVEVVACAVGTEADVSVCETIMVACEEPNGSVPGLMVIVTG